MSQADLAALVNAVVDDPDVKQMVKDLAMDALGEARFMIENGSPAVKMGLIKSLMPALVQSLKETQSGDGLKELRDAQVELFGQMRDAT